MVSCFTVSVATRHHHPFNFPLCRAPNGPLAEEKRACNWCFQQANCALAHKAERGAAAATVDSFVRQSTDRGGGALDRVQQELAGKYERAAGHMTQAGESCAAWVAGGRLGWPAGTLLQSPAIHAQPVAAVRCASDPLNRPLSRLLPYLVPPSRRPLPSDCEFLRKWESLVTLEEAHSVSRRPEIWGLTGDERQALGRCQAGLTLVVSGGGSGAQGWGQRRLAAVTACVLGFAVSICLVV